MRKILLLSALSVALFAGQTHAKATVEVEWKDSASYSDVRPTSETRSSFKKRVFGELEKYMGKLAEDLPDGQTLSLTVTNLDLAGQVWPSSFVGMGSGAQDVRLIKRVDIPRISFSYILKDADGKELKSAEVKLKDMSFMERSRNQFNTSDSFRFEKSMLKDWFDEEMGDQLAKL